MMGSERVALRMRELEEALECGDRITSDAAKILSDCAETLGIYSNKTAPVRDRARTLTTASRNIRQAKERCEQICTSLDMSRRLQGTIQRGPADNVEAFLAAVEELEAANTVLWSNEMLVCVKEAITHSEKLRGDAMSACESDYAATLSSGSKEITRENLNAAKQRGDIELIDPASIPRLKVLTNAMLKGAHQRVITVYTDLRSHVMEQMLMDMGLSTSDFELQSMSLEHLEEKIKRWIEMVSIMTIVATAEKSLVGQVFNASSTDGIFSQVMNMVLHRVSTFGRSIIKTTHTSQKLFSLLDMHQALENELMRLEDVVQQTQCQSRFRDLKALLKEIEDASGVLFDAFQNSVKEDSSKKEIQDGTVHPLTAEVLSFFRRLFKHANFMKVLYGNTATDTEGSQFQIGNHMSGTMVRILMVLQDNLEAKSRGYKSKALAHFFLMNNINFMVTSVAQSKAMELLGAPWVDRQKMILDDHAVHYHQITWEPLMAALDTDADDVTQSNAQRRKAAIKERFKTFNVAFEEIHRTQMEWIIPDPVMKNAVRQRILQSVSPAYAAFYDTFKDANFTKNPDKYLKYDPSEVQRIILEDLYENKIPANQQRRLHL